MSLDELTIEKKKMKIKLRDFESEFAYKFKRPPSKLEKRDKMGKHYVYYTKLLEHIQKK